MVQVCPIVDFKINKKVARLNALFSLVIFILFIFTEIKFFLFLLCLDFFFRAFLRGRYSVISFLNKFLLRLFKIKPFMVNAGPKMFAARLGFLFCSLISLSYLFGFIFISNFLSSIMVILASLELFFGFCFGCKIYTFLHRIGC